METELTFLL